MRLDAAHNVTAQRDCLIYKVRNSPRALWESSHSIRVTAEPERSPQESELIDDAFHTKCVIFIQVRPFFGNMRRQVVDSSLEIAI